MADNTMSNKTSNADPSGSEHPADNRAGNSEDLKAALQSLRKSQQSLVLSTLGDDGQPHVGYTPFIVNGKDLIIFVSQLSMHTRDLMANGKVSVLLIEDESASAQIYARTRVSYQCRVEIISSGNDSYESVLDAMQAAHGKILGLLRQLPDFVLFRLIPQRGQFVVGFGQAYHLKGEHLDEFEHARSA